jgi:putative nucleotidyltransferase with HDIG domain
MVIEPQAKHKPNIPPPLPLRDLVRDTRSVVSLPEAYYRLQELIDDPRHDINLVAKVIESDSGLTARLLKAVNSSLYGLPQRIDRVSYAVSLMGSKALRDLILATAIVRTFGKLPAQLVDLSTFWHHSVYCGLVASHLAKHCRILHKERMLAAGLLHDLGQLVLYRSQPELSARALAQAEPADDGAYLAEQAVFGYTHAEVGAELLKAWRVPESLQEVVRHHHRPDPASPHALEACVVHIANSIANRVEPARNIADCEMRVSPVAWEITGLSEEAVGSALSAANEGFLDTLEILVPGNFEG